MFDASAIQEIAKAAAITNAANAINAQADSGAVALPSDFEIHDLESYFQGRRRARGTMATSAVNDFAAYVLERKLSGAAVFVDQTQLRAVAMLNLGTAAEPGHADDQAVLAPKMTAAFTALRSLNGMKLSQKRVAEFLEDWPDEVIACSNDDANIPTPKAIAAIRKITVESIGKMESTAQNLSASRSTFEQVQAASGPEPLPSHITFACRPYQGMLHRAFVLRVGVHTGDKDPGLSLRVQNMEQHEEEIAAEFASLVRNAIQDDMPVLIGKYTASA